MGFVKPIGFLLQTKNINNLKVLYEQRNIKSVSAEVIKNPFEF